MAQNISWFLSKKGMTFMYRLTSATSIGILTAYTLPNTIFLYKYQDLVQCYKHGIPVKLSSAVLERYNKAVEILKVPDHEKKILKPFTVFGFDMFNAGSTYSRFGGLLGIPHNFTYIDEQYIEKSDIMVNNEPVNWSSEAGQQLLKSLTLSENAQIFAIAREILSLKSLKLLLDACYASSCLILMYGLGKNINVKYNLYSKPLIVRSFMYTIVSVFSFGLYTFLTDFTQIQYEKSVDRKLAENPVFLEGGKEFYEKTILRNIALRKLMGKQGEKYYTVLGNENFFIRQRRLPLLVRKEYFESKIKNVM